MRASSFILKKREDQQAAGVNTVEIDLLRGGTRVLMVDAEHIPPYHRTAYQAVCLARVAADAESSFTECRSRQRLPVIAIPLRPADPDIPLDLQAILAQCYRNGGYDDIDYAGEPDPPLSTQRMTAWADALLREQGKR